MTLSNRVKLFIFTTILACIMYFTILYQGTYEMTKKSHSPYRLNTTPIAQTSISCSMLFEGNETEFQRTENVTFQIINYTLSVLEAKDKCEHIKSTYSFFDKPLSEEEAAYPLAYGMLVHKDPIQVYYLLSAIYQPQNQFCIAVDGKSSDVYYRMMEILHECYPNIHVFKTSQIQWGGYSILTSVFSCVQLLTNLTAPWEYYQYLTGVDVPLKTNLEMVRILKQLNGSFHAELLPFPRGRIKSKKSDSPLPLYKTSLSTMFTRKSAEFMVNSKQVQEMIDWLKDTQIADESLWATVAGNPQYIKMPGGFDAAEYMQRIRKMRKGRKKADIHNMLRYQSMGSNISNLPSHFFIARYQQWYEELCYGMMYQYSCIFGVRDLPMISKRYELIAHKFYMDFQPVAFFCQLEEVRRRALQDSLSGGTSFEASAYANLPNGPNRVN